MGRNVVEVPRWAGAVAAVAALVAVYALVNADSRGVMDVVYILVLGISGAVIWGAILPHSEGNDRNDGNDSNDGNGSINDR